MIAQQHMGIIRTTCLIVLAILLCSLSSISSDEGKKTEEVLLSQLVDLASGEIDRDMADMLWLNCKIDLIKLKDKIEKLDFCLPGKTSSCANEFNRKRWSLEKESIHKMVSLLHPEVKQTLLDCLRKNNIIFRVSGEEGGSKVWYASYVEYIYGKRAGPRRNLGIDSPHWIKKVSATSPSPSHSEVHDLKHSSVSQKTYEKASISEDSGANAQEKNDGSQSVVIAIVVTACVTFIIAAGLFLCCYKFCGGGSKMRLNDDSPLLSLSMTDLSVGSFSVGNSMKEEKSGHQSFGNNASHHGRTSSLDDNFNIDFNEPHASLNGIPSLEDISTDSNPQVPPPPGDGVLTSFTGLPPLKPPPGRADLLPPKPRSSFKATSMGLLPLKPPPGRTDLLPPKPRSSFKAPSIKTGPGPPLSPPAPLPPSEPSRSAGPSPPRPPPPPLPGGRPGPHSPPRPGGVPPPCPPKAPLIGSKRAPPPAPKHNADEGDGPKTKLKPFFWDKVLANPDQSMVWHQLKAGSFQFDENMIESLFGYAATDKNKNERKKDAFRDSQPQLVQIIEPKKSQNLSILLRALNLTVEEVCDALLEGNELPSEFLQTLLKMAPTPEEELKLRLYSGELDLLGPADRFLKTLVNIPFAFKRLEALFFMCTLEEEVATTKESFETLEIACKELRNSRIFLKLLEAVLKTGNRMNDGTFRGGAQAFKLDTLLKLSDVKGIDGKTTLLHFVVQEIIRSEGVRAARKARDSGSFSSINTEDLLQEASHESDEHYRSLGLQVVSGLGDELKSVKKAANMDADCLTGTVGKLNHALQRIRDFLLFDMKNVEEESGFHEALKSFVKDAEGDMKQLLEEEKRIMALVKSTGDYFHGNAGRDEGLRLFSIVRDFLIILDKVCREVRETQKIPPPTKTQKKETSSSDPHQPPSLKSSSSIESCGPPSTKHRDLLFPAITDRRMQDSSSDEESP